MFDPFSLCYLFFSLLCWGSFLNVVGFRLIQGKSLLAVRMCPSCHQKLAWYDLIPFFSFAFFVENAAIVSAISVFILL